MSAAETDTICLGETSMYSTSSAVTILNSPPARAEMLSAAILPRPSMGVFAWAMTKFSPSTAERYSISSVTLPFFTFRYGASIKPYSFTRAYVASETMSPMFGPSGVSMGQILP